MTKEHAEKLGFKSMTRPYILPEEHWMLANVLSDLARGNIEALIIDNEVYRKPNAS